MKQRVIRLLAFVGGLAIAAGIVCAVGALAMVRQGFAARETPSAIEARLARSMRRMAAPRGAREARNPVAATPETLAGARAHWADHCATCHANDGSGQTQIGQGLYPKAPDMRLPATQKLSDGELYYIIENGIRLTGMPAWGNGAPGNHESWALVAFIRHLPKLTPEELSEMRKLNPVSPAEANEAKEEEEFLRGKDDPGKVPPAHEHGH